MSYNNKDRKMTSNEATLTNIASHCSRKIHEFSIKYMDITEQIFHPKIKSVEYPNMQIMCTASIIPDTNLLMQSTFMKVLRPTPASVIPQKQSSIINI